MSSIHSTGFRPSSSLPTPLNPQKYPPSRIPKLRVKPATFNSKSSSHLQKSASYPYIQLDSSHSKLMSSRIPRLLSAPLIRSKESLPQASSPHLASPSLQTASSSGTSSSSRDHERQLKTNVPTPLEIASSDISVNLSEIRNEIILDIKHCRASFEKLERDMKNEIAQNQAIIKGLPPLNESPDYYINLYRKYQNQKENVINDPDLSNPSKEEEVVRITSEIQKIPVSYEHCISLLRAEEEIAELEARLSLAKQKFETELAQLNKDLRGLDVGFSYEIAKLAEETRRLTDALKKNHDYYAREQDAFWQEQDEFQELLKTVDQAPTIIREYESLQKKSEEHSNGIRAYKAMEDVRGVLNDPDLPSSTPSTPDQLNALIIERQKVDKSIELMRKDYDRAKEALTIIPGLKREMSEACFRAIDKDCRDEYEGLQKQLKQANTRFTRLQQLEQARLSSRDLSSRSPHSQVAVGAGVSTSHKARAATLSPVSSPRAQVAVASARAPSPVFLERSAPSSPRAQMAFGAGATSPKARAATPSPVSSPRSLQDGDSRSPRKPLQFTGLFSPAFLLSGMPEVAVGAGATSPKARVATPSPVPSPRAQMAFGAGVPTSPKARAATPSPVSSPKSLQDGDSRSPRKPLQFTGLFSPASPLSGTPEVAVGAGATSPKARVGTPSPVPSPRSDQDGDSGESPRQPLQFTGPFSPASRLSASPEVAVGAGAPMQPAPTAALPLPPEDEGSDVESLRTPSPRRNPPTPWGSLRIERHPLLAQLPQNFFERIAAMRAQEEISYLKRSELIIDILEVEAQIPAEELKKLYRAITPTEENRDPGVYCYYDIGQEECIEKMLKYLSELNN